jgi:DnaK suppressor protein
MQENHRQRLLEILDTCVVQMRTDDGNGAPLLAQCPDENEYASRLAEAGLSLSLRRRAAERRWAIERALKRLEAGEYGLCAECGEDIGQARLAANPTAVLCVLCQAELENRPRHGEDS